MQDGERGRRVEVVVESCHELVPVARGATLTPERVPQAFDLSPVPPPSFPSEKSIGLRQ